MNQTEILTGWSQSYEILYKAYLKPYKAFNRGEILNQTGVFTKITDHQCEILYQTDLELKKTFEYAELSNRISDLVTKS